MDSAEQAALSQLSEEKRTIRIGKCENIQEIGARVQPNNEHEMAFKKNRHFDYCYVNTSFSCLLFPSTVSSEGE